MSPKDCKTLEQVCKLKTDNYDNGNFGIITDSFTVSITNQKLGERPTQDITIPKKIFDNLIHWYMKDQTK